MKHKHKEYHLVALPGEGIGIEVVEASLQILLKVAQIKGFSVKIDYGLIGQAAFNKLGDFFPESTAGLCEGADGILFGAVSKGGLLETKKTLRLFC